MYRALSMAHDLSPTEAAELLGVHKKTVKKWANAGTIPAWQTPGGWWRFNAADLEAWRAKHQITPEHAS